MNQRVVVTGLGAVTPLGNDVPTTWQSLLSGISGVGCISRFPTDGFSTTIAAEIKDLKAEDFIDAKELKRLDPFALYALIAAGEAWRHSELDRNPGEPTRIGVLIGSGIGGITTLESQFRVLLEKGPRRISPFFVPMMIGNIAAGQVSIAFGAKGPVNGVVSACATGTNAIGDAYRLIARGDADIMIAGGSEAAITPMGMGGFCSARALSTRNDDPQAASRPFDRDRDGFVVGEGCGIVILESLTSARNREVAALAEICGYGCAGDAYHVVQPHPESEGAIRALAAAIADAGWRPEDVDYVNAHGTSTPYNDPLETKALKKVLGDHAYRIAVNSTKSMTGHMLGAAGAVEFITTVLTLYNGLIHPTINLDNPDSECDLDYVPNSCRQLPVKRALSNSLGFGGHNATLAVARWEE